MFANQCQIMKGMYVQTLAKIEEKLADIAKTEQRKERSIVTSTKTIQSTRELRSPENSKSQKKTKKSIPSNSELKKKRKMEECFGKEEKTDDKRRKIRIRTCTVTQPSNETPTNDRTPSRTNTVTQTTIDSPQIEQKSNASTFQQQPQKDELLLDEGNEFYKEIDEIASKRLQSVVVRREQTQQPDLRRFIEEKGAEIKHRIEESRTSTQVTAASGMWNVKKVQIVKKSTICNHCTRNHVMSNCDRFKSLSIRERRERVKSLTLCENCFIPLILLRGPHRCTKGPCRCGKPHNTLFCFKPREQRNN